MKYCVLIMDGAAGLPLPGYDGRTSLEIARTPHLDMMAGQGVIGLARTVPPGMEPSSACACMSVLGYDPRVYYRGRAAIEARSMGVPVGEGEAVFRCNLVSIKDGRMWDYSAGHITTAEASRIIESLNKELGNSGITFYPGIGYRHMCKIKDREETLRAECTPPHDIPDLAISGYLPQGPGSELLLDLMRRSVAVLQGHPVNRARLARGEKPVSMIWLFWGTGQVPEMPPFRQVYGVSAALTSAVDLLRGLAAMADMRQLEIAGVTDGPDNDYKAQAAGALAALAEHDLAVIHVEAPDEAGHGGSVQEKVSAIERIDADIISRLAGVTGLRVLVMPDHPTPIPVRTHTPEPVPFLLWGPGFRPNGARRFTEAEGLKSGLFIDPGYTIMMRLIKV